MIHLFNNKKIKKPLVVQFYIGKKTSFAMNSIKHHVRGVLV